MADIFSAADMAVCLSRDSINRQFAALAQQSLIPSRLLVYRQTDPDNSSTFTAVTQPSDVPRNAPSISANICPQIDIVATGKSAVLVIRFLKGSTGNFRYPDDISGMLYPLDMEGWSFGTAVDAGLACYGKGGLVLPPSVKARLQRLADDMFDIRHIFLDLDSADHASADPATTYVADPRQWVRDAFTAFMHFYLKDLQASGNPFVLGSVLLAAPGAVYRNADGQQAPVPDLLAPAGLAVSLFRDQQYPGRSCLCLAMATRGGHGTAGGGGSAPNLMANPIKRDGIDGVVAFSRAVLLEPLLLRPVYEQIRDRVRNQVQGALALEAQEYGGDFPSVLAQLPYGSYNPASGGFGGVPVIQAMHLSWQEVLARLDGPAPITWSYAVASANHDDDRYSNGYTVKVLPRDSSMVSLRFDGNLYVFKQHTSCHATAGREQAWASFAMSWSAIVNIGASNNSNGIEISIVTADTAHDANRDSGHNSGASPDDQPLSVGNIGTGLSSSPLSLLNVFSGIDLIDLAGAGAIGAAIQGVGTVIGSCFIMPAGGTCLALSPQIDPMGNYQLDLAMRA